MEFTSYKINECFEHLYYQIPMELFFNPKYNKKLNSDSKILYGFLLNRLKLSKRNDCYDESGNIYLIFTRKDVQELLNLSDKTVTKAFKQLADCKLIYEKKQGSTKPNLIYVGKIKHDEKLTKVTRKNYNSRGVKSTSHESENLRPNNNYNNYISKNNNRYKFATSSLYTELMKDSIDYAIANAKDYEQFLQIL